MNQQISMEKFFEMYGKVCLERDMAIAQANELTAEMQELRKQLVSCSSESEEVVTSKKKK